MKHRTFFWFFLPTALAMLVFIAAPLVSIVMQSLFVPHEAVLIETENCASVAFSTARATVVFPTPDGPDMINSIPLIDAA